MRSKVFLIVLFLCFLCAGFVPCERAAAGDTDDYVKTIRELNQALGGNHKVQGNTITLRSDVVVKDTIGIAYYTMDEIVIEMNGHTIKSVSKNGLFGIDSPRGMKKPKNLKIYLRGKGKIQAKNTIFSVDNDSSRIYDGKQEIRKGVCLYFDGDITYQATGKDGCVVSGGWRITINDGTFEAERPISAVGGDIEYAGELTRQRSYIVINGGTIKGDCLFEKAKWKMTGGTIIGNVKTDCVKNYIKDCTIDGRLKLGSNWGGYENNLQVKENAKITKGLQVDSGHARIHVMGGTITGEDVAIDVIGYGTIDNNRLPCYIKISGGVVQATGENSIGIRTLDLSDDTEKLYTRVILEGGEVIADTPVVNVVKNGG